MRKLMALAIVLAFAGATRSWAAFGLGDVAFDGSLEVSGNSANNEQDRSAANDHRGDTNTRVRLGMNAQVTEGVNARLELIRAGANAGFTDTRYGGSGRPTSLTSEEGNFFFHNAYIDIADLLGQKLFRLGRQYVGNPGDLVWNISPTDDDELTPNSIDGLLIQNRTWDFINIDLFTGKATEDENAAAETDANNTAGDVNLSSLDIVLPKLVPGAAVNIGYLWGVDESTSSVSNDNKLTTTRVGINGGVRENFFTYRAEYFMNGGENETLGNGTSSKVKYKGSAIDLGVAVNPAETSVGGFGIWANYVMGSGDDNTTDNDDESFHDFSALGFNTSDRLFGEIFGKSNTLGGGVPRGQGLDGTGAAQNGGLTVLNLGVSFKPKMIAKTTFKLDWFQFTQTEDGQIQTVGGPNVDIGDTFGSEIDFTVGYAHSDNVNIEAGYAMLTPDDALTGVATPANPDEDITKSFARLKVKWGGESK